MSLLIVSFISGILTILAPCVLPLLPVIVGGSITNKSKSRPFIITLSLAASVVLFTLLLKVSTIFINIPQETWLYISGGIVLVFGILTLFPESWEKISFALKLYKSEELMQKSSEKKGILGPILIGMSLGPVFASCSPTYALILATVLPQNFSKGLLALIVYAIGLALVMLLVAFLGQKLVARLKWLSNPKGFFKRILGIIFIIVGLMIITGYEKKLEQYILEKGFFDVTKLEQQILKNTELKNSNSKQTTEKTQNQNSTTSSTLPILGSAPEISGITSWINSAPLTLEQLKGKVVIVDFWTFSCINCIRTLPHVQGWYEKYKDKGLVIIGVHYPEFAFERIPENVEKAAKEYKLTYPIAIDNDGKTWDAYENRYWPASYFIDKNDQIRATHFGEGNYDENEKIIQELLSENGENLTEMPLMNMPDVAINLSETPETYLGYDRAERFLNTKDETKLDQVATYTLPDELDQNSWALGGSWNVGPQDTVSAADKAKLGLVFSAKEAYLVMGSKTPAKVEIELNGEKSTIEVSDSKLYTVAKLQEFAKNNYLELTFPKDVTVHAFTFGS